MTINPDVLSHNLAILREIKVFLQLEGQALRQRTLREQLESGILRVGRHTFSV